MLSTKMYRDLPEGFCFLDRVFDRADQVERLLRQIVVLTCADFLERADRVFDLHELALDASELLGNEERLRQGIAELYGRERR